MTQPPDKQLSRRDALKLLGAAAGASVLANLPSKWSTPQSVAGVLPAHAQGSCTRIFQATFDYVEDRSSIQVFQSVTPTWESPAPKFEFPVFDLLPADAGYTASWECKDGCLQVGFNALWSFRFPDGNTDLNIIDGTVFINLGTGEYGRSWVENSPADLPDGCRWF